MTIFAHMNQKTRRNITSSGNSGEVLLPRVRRWCHVITLSDSPYPELTRRICPENGEDLSFLTYMSHVLRCQCRLCGPPAHMCSTWAVSTPSPSVTSELLLSILAVSASINASYHHLSSVCRLPHSKLFYRYAITTAIEWSTWKHDFWTGWRKLAVFYY